MNHSLYHADTDVQFSGNCPDPGATPTELPDCCLDVMPDPWSTETLALRPRSSKASVDSLHDHLALELCEDAAHAQHRLSSGRRRVQRLLVQINADSELVHLSQEAHELVKRAPDAIHGPRQHDIEAPPRGVSMEPVESWSLVPSLGT